MVTLLVFPARLVFGKSRWQARRITGVISCHTLRGDFVGTGRRFRYML